MDVEMTDATAGHVVDTLDLDPSLVAESRISVQTGSTRSLREPVVFGLSFTRNWMGPVEHGLETRRRRPPAPGRSRPFTLIR